MSPISNVTNHGDLMTENPSNNGPLNFSCRSPTRRIAIPRSPTPRSRAVRSPTRCSPTRCSPAPRSPTPRSRTPRSPISHRARHSSDCANADSLDDGEVIDRCFMDISDVEYDTDDREEGDDRDDESSPDHLTPDAGTVRIAEKRLGAAIGELRALDSRIQREHRKYAEARIAGVGARRFLYSRRLQLLVLEGVRAAFSAHTAKCRDRLYDLIR